MTRRLRGRLTLALSFLLVLIPLSAGIVLAVGDAVDDLYYVAEDSALVVPTAPDIPSLLANDTTDGETLCVTGFNTTGLQGTLDSAGVTDGSFNYTPPANWNGTTTFTYDVAAAAGGVCPVGTVEDSATVTITVTPVNDAPTALADFFSALKNRTLTIGAPGVLGNDSDVDGDSLTAVKANSPVHGVVTLAADGGFSYTPSDGYTGPDAFSYRASDGTATSAVRVVNLTVSAIPPTPTPTPVPTPVPTASPEPSPSESPLPSDSGLPSPSPVDTGLLPSESPSASPATNPTTGGGGLPIAAVGALALLIALLGVAAFYFVRSQRNGDGDDDGYDPDTSTGAYGDHDGDDTDDGDGDDDSDD